MEFLEETIHGAKSNRLKSATKKTFHDLRIGIVRLVPLWIFGTYTSLYTWNFET